jgi:enterochelin esterase-like enzyme
MVTGLARAALCVAALVGATTAGSAAAAAPNASDNNLPLGPTVIRTGEAPTGYSVTFRYDAPDGVETVQIFGEWLFSRPEAIVSSTTGDFRWGVDWQPGDVGSGPWQTAEMTGGGDGIWTWTTPLPAGTFSYTFTHDCANTSAAGCARHVDPANPGWSIGNAPGTAQTLSQVYVPQHPRFPTYDNEYQEPVKPAKAGALHQRTYTSPTSTNPPGTHQLSVYLPAGYDPDRDVPYPTLYISHGAGGNDSDWTTQGAAQHILENAVAAGAAPPMVIIGTNANGIPGGNTGYVNDLRNNVIPFVEADYNVSTSPADRAFAGLSAGGSRAITLLYDHTALFEYYGAWSPAVFGAGVPNAAQIARMLEVQGGIHMGTGLQDYLINIGPNSVARVAALQSAGIDVTEFNVEGSHTWYVWRALLDDFLRHVAFRSTTTRIDVTAAGPQARLSAEVEALTTSTARPSGMVEFWSGETLIGSAPLRADGTAVLHPTPKDSHAGHVVARYTGDARFNPSTSVPMEA